MLAFPDHFGAVIVGALKWALVTGLVSVVVELLGKGGGKGVENGVVGAQHVHGDQPGSEEGGAVIVQ